METINLKSLSSVLEVINLASSFYLALLEGLFVLLPMIVTLDTKALMFLNSPTSITNFVPKAAGPWVAKTVFFILYNIFVKMFGPPYSFTAFPSNVVFSF